MRGLRAALVLAASLLLLGLPAPASAATPCWRQLINDWYDGRIDKVYPVRCYQQALKEAPEDAKIYSDLPSDLSRALQQAIRRQDDGDDGGGGTTTGSTRVPAGGEGRDLDEDATAAPPLPGRDDPKGVFGRVLDFIGPNNADSIPLPLIFLAGLALLLMAAGAAGVVTRRVQMRRLAVQSPPPKPPVEP